MYVVGYDEKKNNKNKKNPSNRNPWSTHSHVVSFIYVFFMSRYNLLLFLFFRYIKYYQNEKSLYIILFYNVFVNKMNNLRNFSWLCETFGKKNVAHSFSLYNMIHSINTSHVKFTNVKYVCTLFQPLSLSSLSPSLCICVLLWAHLCVLTLNVSRCFILNLNH